jgi:GT2 family glycosyltransferase
MRHWAQDNEAEVEVLSGCFWVARTQSVQQIGGLDERFFFYAEDVDWCKRFKDAGWKVVFVPSAIATHFGGGSSANAPLRYEIELLRANLAYWKKHAGPLSRLSFYLLLLLHHLFRFAICGLCAVSPGKDGLKAREKCRRYFCCLKWLLTGTEIYERPKS